MRKRNRFNLGHTAMEWVEIILFVIGFAGVALAAVSWVLMFI